jgi:hypothetical protein
MGVHRDWIHRGGLCVLQLFSLAAEKVAVDASWCCAGRDGDRAEHGNFDSVSRLQVFDDVDEGTDDRMFSSNWVLVTRVEAFLDSLRVFHDVEEFERDPEDCPLWTDRYHNLFDVMNRVR